MTEGPTLGTAEVIAALRAAGCVFAEDEASLILAQAESVAAAREMVQLRASGVPLEHVLGWADFGGLRVALSPGVFVPRRRSQYVVELASALIGTCHCVVLDLCCGSGALGLALARSRRIELHAADVDDAAVRCARANLAAVGGRVYQGDLYAPLPEDLRGRIDVLLANAPYVPTEAISLLPPEARLHEPRVALDGGDDGLRVLRRVIAGAPQWLAPGGTLLMQSSESQSIGLAQAATGAGLIARADFSEELDAVVVTAARPR